MVESQKLADTSSTGEKILGKWSRNLEKIYKDMNIGPTGCLKGAEAKQNGPKRAPKGGKKGPTTTKEPPKRSLADKDWFWVREKVVPRNFRRTFWEPFWKPFSIKI